MRVDGQAGRNAPARVPAVTDPRGVPIDPETDLPAPLAPVAYTVDALRHRFSAPPVWQPEFTGDGLRHLEAPWRDASVLMPIVTRGEEPTVLLTQRTANLSRHAGQIAFPGGRADPEDASPVATALREAQEEVGLGPAGVEVIGTLPIYRTGTGYQVTPVVALVRPDFTLKLQPFEVAEAFEVPLSFLMNPAHYQRRRFQTDAGDRVFYAIPYRPGRTANEYFIWGATAAMLRNLYRFLSA